MQYDSLKLVHFSKKSGRPSSTGSEILTFGSHCSANFQPILDCFIPKFKLEYDNLESIKADHVNAVAFNLHQIKRLKLFLGHPVLQIMQYANSKKDLLTVCLWSSCLRQNLESKELIIFWSIQKSILNQYEVANLRSILSVYVVCN